MDNLITHTGIVEKIEGQTIFVRISQQSACAGCHAKGMCSASESKEKIIEVTDDPEKYHLNEEVVITGKNSMGFQAVFIAFVLPLLLAVAVVVYGNYQGWEESYSALAGLGTLIPYYLMLYAMRDKLKRKFIFTLKKRL